jgi:hypothetical protein
VPAIGSQVHCPVPGDQALVSGIEDREKGLLARVHAEPVRRFLDRPDR